MKNMINVHREILNSASYARASRTGKDCGKNDAGTCRHVKYSVDKIVRDGHYWRSSVKADKPYVQAWNRDFFHTSMKIVKPKRREPKTGLICQCAMKKKS